MFRISPETCDQKRVLEIAGSHSKETWDRYHSVAAAAATAHDAAGSDAAGAAVAAAWAPG